MAREVDINENDLSDFRQIHKLFEAGESLRGFHGRIKELANVYKTKSQAFKGLDRILAEVRYQEELANKMQTFASDQDRSQSEVFDEQATAIGDRITRTPAAAERLALDDYSARFLGLEEGSHAKGDVEWALRAKISDYYLSIARETVAKGFEFEQKDKDNPVLWGQIGASIRSLRVRLARLPFREETDADLARHESNISNNTAIEEQIAARFAGAVLTPPPDCFKALGELLEHVRVKGLVDGGEMELAHRFVKSIYEVGDALVAHEARTRQQSTLTWIQRLERLRARTEGDEWANVQQDRRELIERIIEEIDSVSGLCSGLRTALAKFDTQVASRPRGAEGAVPTPEHLRKAWARLNEPLGKLVRWLTDIRAAFVRLGDLVPRNPPNVDAAAKNWSSWLADTKKKLTETLTECGVADAAELARDCLSLSERELKAWQIRARTKPEVTREIDSGAPWEKVMATASAVGEVTLAEWMRKILSSLQNAATWRDLKSVCDGIEPTSISISMYALSRSDKLVEKLAGLLLDAAEETTEIGDWHQPWLDGFDDDALQWALLMRHVAHTRRLLREPGCAIALLLEPTADSSRTALLLEAHRQIRSIREPELEPTRFPVTAQHRVRQLLGDLRREREATEVRLEARIALYAALTLVPLNEGGDGGPKPRWSLRDPSAWDVHLSPEWSGLLKVCDQLYSKTRALAPLSRRVFYKSELALLGLTKTLHLSPFVFGNAAEGAGASSGAGHVPSANEILRLVSDLEKLVATVTKEPEVWSFVRDKLERQLVHIGLGLLALNLERPGDPAVSTARRTSQSVMSPGFGKPATNRQMLRQLLRVLDDAGWVTGLTSSLDGQDPLLKQSLRQALDLGSGPGGDLALRISRVLEQLECIDDHDIEPGDLAEIVSDAIEVAGVGHTDGDGRVLLAHVRSSIREYVQRYTRQLDPRLRESLLVSLRRQVVESPDNAELRRRVDQLLFLDPNDVSGKSLRNHIFKSHN